MLSKRVTEAADNGAGFVLTPEVSNCVSVDRAHQQKVLRSEDDDPMLAAMRRIAADRGLWLSLGSLALKTEEDRFANRSFLIGPDGGIGARYDKIHMFDVDLSDEIFRESAAFRPGDTAVSVPTPFAKIGLTICYDLRFAYLFRALAKAGAQVITVPAAFAPSTGRAHWEPLLRARAIETGCYVLAAAQCGTHPASVGRERATHGHAMAVSPWGEVLQEAGGSPETLYVDLDLDQVTEARRKVPALSHDRPFDGP